MDERSPKRRKVSSSPSTEERSRRRTPRRASYMSPTKASLARFNPNLLKSPHLSKSPRRPSSRRETPAITIDDDVTMAEDFTEPTAVHRPTPTGMEGSTTDARAAGNLFEDLDLGSNSARHAAPTLNESAAGKGTYDEAQSHYEPDVEKTRSAKVQEKEELLEELQAMKQSCRQMEHLLTQARNSNGQSSMDDKYLEKIAILLEDEGTLSQEVQAQPMTALLDSLLPFANPIPTAVDADEGLDVPSHRPLELQNPLPCLQLFTRLCCSLETGPPRTGKDTKGSVLSLQEQHLRLEDWRKTLFASIDFEVSTTAEKDTVPKLTKLSISDIPYWARQELSPWVKERQADRDLGCLTYGLGSYHEMSLKRAEVWQACEKRYANLIGYAEDEEGENANPGLSVTALRARLGRTSLVLQSAEVTFLIQWRLQLDWTGEAESLVTANAAFARPYHDLDNRKSLSKVPVTFDRLVKDRGVLAAIDAMVSVLFSG